MFWKCIGIKNYYVNIGTHLFKGNEHPMTFSVQILDKKWVCSTEKGFMGVQAPQKSSIAFCTAECHRQQKFDVPRPSALFSNTCAVPVWPWSYSTCFWQKIMWTKWQSYSLQMAFSGRDGSKGDVRNTGRVPTFSLVMMPMKSTDLWIPEIGNPCSEKHSERLLKHRTPFKWLWFVDLWRNLESYLHNMKVSH